MAFTTPRTWTDGELVNAAILNPHVRDNFEVMGPHLIVRKTADESVTSSTTLQDDNSLILPVGASEVWLTEWIVLYEGSSTGDIKLAFTFPAAGSINFVGILGNESATLTARLWTGTTTPTTAYAFTGSGSGVATVLSIKGVFTNSSTAGNVTMQWAQNVSDGTASKVLANSTLWGYQLV